MPRQQSRERNGIHGLLEVIDGERELGRSRLDGIVSFAR